MDPRVSVVIPTYNRREWLGEAVDSVLAQTFRDFEVIVVDDGSTDGTPEWVRTRFPGVRCLPQPRGGVSRARNRGAAEGRGLYLAFLDSDDLWLPRKLERQVACMEAGPGRVLCHTDEMWRRDGCHLNPKQRHRKEGGNLFGRSLGLCLISPSSVLMRRDFFAASGGFDEDMPVCEDYDLWLRITIRREVDFVPEKLVVKRGGHAGQLSAAPGLDYYRIYALVKLLACGAPDPRQREQILAVLGKKCGVFAQGAQKRGRGELARRILEIPAAVSSPAASRDVLRGLQTMAPENGLN